ncbi:hypothetical protein Murru_2995 [Allomuricauda ruestringensis DSM 13258]|uniref:Uncharacterized protein n=1 Tax=Allomuricauda ruestringensis (strain DSM 13258 / CIP 107369 / LMG 19739 / B1) TaxID=886377 RepID=G2PK32_ALLRU|nr:hypothetical protein Murru_2995 [Allomuricauda ruestringensis DSM 13258]
MAIREICVKKEKEQRENNKRQEIRDHFGLRTSDIEHQTPITITEAIVLYLILIHLLRTGAFNLMSNILYRNVK